MKCQQYLKTSSNYCLVLCSPPKNENFVSTSKNRLKTRNWTFPVVRSLTRKLEFVKNIFWVIVSRKISLLVTCPRLLQICLLNEFLNSHDFGHSFNVRLEQLICKNALKFVILNDYFSNLFTEVLISYWKPFKFGLGRSFRKMK